MDDSAVSPVVGTILMVAIAVVLAGVLFVVVSTVGNPTDSPDYHDLALSKDELTDEIMFVKVSPALPRSEFQLRLSVAGDFEVDRLVGTGGDALQSGTFVAIGGAADGPPDGMLETGSYIHLCAEPAASEVFVEVRHAESNSIVWSGTFLALADCPT